MATSYTPTLRLAQMVPGDPTVKNLWGIVWDATVAAVEQAVSGTTGITLSNPTLTLTANNNAPDQARSQLLNFIGALSTPVTVTLPQTARMAWAVNNTTVGQAVILTTGRGASLTLPFSGNLINLAAGFCLYVNDGSNVTAAPLYAAGYSSATGFMALATDAGGLQFRAVGGAYGAGLRNDGASCYLMSTNSGSPNGGYSTLRPFSWTMGTGAVTIDATGAGVYMGGILTTTGHIQSSVGYANKAGISGGVIGNIFNIYWNGVSSAFLYIDDTNLGVINTSPSDARYKHSVKPLAFGALERIKLLAPISYRWQDKGLFKDDGITREGFLAQDVQRIIPSGAIGDESSDDPMSINVLPLLAVLIGAVQELAGQVEDLRTHLVV